MHKSLTSVKQDAMHCKSPDLKSGCKASKSESETIQAVNSGEVQLDSEMQGIGGGCESKLVSTGSTSA
jgi:hypothetical protein